MASVTPWPDHLLSLAEWDGLDEDCSRRFELVVGVLLVVPRPAVIDQRVGARLSVELDRQLPDEWTAVPDVEVVLDTRSPATVRAPDVVVVPFALAATNPARVFAVDALLVVEVASPGTVRTDRIMKPVEYAEAGIAHYWRIELGPPVTLVVYQLRSGHTDAQEPARSGRLDIEQPYAVTLDLDTLTARR